MFGGIKLFRKLIKEAMHRPEKEQDLFMDKLKDEVGEEVLMRAYYELYVFLHGCHFCEETAHYAVSEMVNANKTKGESVTKATTDEWARKLNLTWECYNEWDWYYVVNMVASDYYGIIDQNTYYKVAKAWLEDVDVAKGKAFLYWCKVVKRF